MILGNRSVAHLSLVFDAFEKIAEMSVEDSIKHELSGDFERLMLAVGEELLSLEGRGGVGTRRCRDEEVSEPLRRHGGRGGVRMRRCQSL
ncbi:Annexin A6 [Liparis tanakae]|uniref:Annexin A6 n=1 Tax=Liparis tanakae TaxID=230148 RepID=A0A4Z2F396_9TELE|nr:Annexin A6 [Liparis tanakae]